MESRPATPPTRTKLLMVKVRADGRGAAADRGPDGQGANASSDAIQVSCNAIVDPDGQHGRAGTLLDAIH